MLTQSSDPSYAAIFFSGGVFVIVTNIHRPSLGKMVGEPSLDADITSCEMTGSSASHPPVPGPENSQEMNGKQQNPKKNKAKDESNKTVPFHKLFSFADSWDHLLMFVGTVSAVGNGLSMPLMVIIIGDAIDAFGRNANTKQAVHDVSKVMTSTPLLRISVEKYQISKLCLVRKI